VAYDPVHDYVYVVNSLGDSVTVVDAATRVVVDTLSADFDQPFHVATNSITGKAYVTNFGDHTITVLNGDSVTGSVDLSGGDPTTQPYGVTVDETRDLVYVAAVDSHRVAVIGTDAGGTSDQVLGWATLNRGSYGSPPRPPMGVRRTRLCSSPRAGMGISATRPRTTWEPTRQRVSPWIAIVTGYT
jgi:YVTN family beta-propeller protein